MPKKKESGGGGGDEWLATYADMVTLLLTFFAVLLSMSTVDEVKFNAFIESFSQLPDDVIESLIAGEEEGEGDQGPIEIQNEMTDLYLLLSEYVEENDQADAVSISMVDDVIYIRFSSDLFFEPDEYTLTPESLPILDFVGTALKEYEQYLRLINISGHTATVNEGVPTVTSWLLSGERAAIVAMYFESEKTFDPNKLVVVGYGKHYPVASNDTEEGRRLNRRVELVIVGEDSDVEFDIYQDMSDLYEATGDNLPTETENPDLLDPENPPPEPLEREDGLPESDFTPGGDTPPVAPDTPDTPDIPEDPGVSPYEE